MQRRRICVVITARPSYSRVKTALEAISRHPGLQLQLVVAASALLDKYGMAVEAIERDGFQPAAKIFSLIEGENLAASAKTTAVGLLESSTVFGNLAPDMVVTVADRYETMATAIAAAYMNIPLVHIQGGEVTGNIDEKVRHAVTKLADYHFVASEGARERVIRLGEDPAAVFNTGCPSIDLASRVMQSPEFGEDVYRKYGGVGSCPDLRAPYLVVMQHPVTTETGQARQQTLETLHAVEALGLPALWFWPNVDAGSDETASAIRWFREQGRLEHVHFFKNMEPDDFLRLLHHSACLVGNSSVGIRECSFLGVPVVNIGSRQHRRDRGGNVVDVPHEREAIQAAIRHWLSSPRPRPEQVYGGGDAGERTAELLATLPLKFHKTICY